MKYFEKALNTTLKLQVTFNNLIKSYNQNLSENFIIDISRHYVAKESRSSKKSFIPDPIKNEQKEVNTKEQIHEKQIETKQQFDPFILKSDKVKFSAKESSVPSSSFSRAARFGLLGVQMFGSAFTEKMLDTNNSKSINSYMASSSNAERLSRTLCKMRGAALKFGQILSTFESKVIPETLLLALEKARAEADAMPKKELLKVLNRELGDKWRDKFSEFDLDPFAAASIGQVHKAKTLDGIPVAVKIQFPGVAASIDSDLNNIKRVFKYFNLIPKGMFIDNLILNLGKELKEECDYIVEAQKQMKYREYVSDDSDLVVPKIFSDLTSDHIITSEFLEGINIDEMTDASQEFRDFIGSKVLELCLKEIFLYKFMQTDPNPANFFILKNNKIGIIDFGAAREYSDEFVANYLQIVFNSSRNNKEEIIKYSKRIGLLTGLESNIMLEAHCSSALAVGEPFNIKNDDLFDFGNQDVTSKLYKEIPTMLKHRLTSPPTEVYSLHRRLSGTLLLCIKLKSRVYGKEMFDRVYQQFMKRNNKI